MSQPEPQNKEEASPRFPRGLFARVARKLSPPVTRQHVRYVALGQCKSRRVEEALSEALQQESVQEASDAA